VHRDLKLENILIDKDGYIKVIDYGLAKKLAKGQKSYDFMGTFLYMAPEMVTKMGHDKAVDWWAVGVTIYELMFGFVPFIGKTKNERFDKICR
jgi:serine/threonine protein kinase